jgi:hypothetical protein
MVRAGLDPARTIDEMRAASAGDRVVEDVESALASGVTYSPALFIDGRRCDGDLDPGAVADALRDASCRRYALGLARSRARIGRES